MPATSIAVKFMTDVARLRVLGAGFAENQPVWLCYAILHEIFPRGVKLIRKSYIVE